MKVLVRKRGDRFEADPVELPGSPPVGRGGSIEEALGKLLICYQHDLGVEIEVDDTAKADEQRRRVEALSQR